MHNTCFVRSHNASGKTAERGNRMRSIVMCDDDPIFLAEFRSQVEEYFAKRSIEITLTAFTSGEELLSSDMLTIDLLLLDIRLNTCYGIDVARQLRETNPNMCLVFVTEVIESYPIIIGYEVGAIRYLVKSNIHSMFDEYMGDVVRRLGWDRVVLNIELYEHPGRALFLDDVVYFESENKAIMVCTASQERMLAYRHKKLDELKHELPAKSFVRIHQSYLVNLAFIERVENDQVILSTKQPPLQVSRSKKQDTIQKYYEYKGWLAGV